MLAEHEMFERFGGGETSKQGQAVETSSCQTNNVGHFRQAFNLCSEIVCQIGFVNSISTLWGFIKVLCLIIRVQKLAETLSSD